MRFQKISDPTDFMDFWSAFRNESWFLSWIHSSEQREQFIRHIMSKWSDEVYNDVANMCSQESGWSFHSIICVDIRIAQDTPTNRLRFAGSPKKRPFHPLLQGLFNRLVLDPSLYLREGHNKNNYCVPACILLALHNRLGPPLRTLRNLAKIEAELDLLNFTTLLEVAKPGIAISQLSAFEKLLSPISPALLRIFPALVVYRGISLNLYTVRRANNDFRLFPTSLSENSRNNEYFQVDMVVDNDDIREAKDERASHTPKGVLHCLLITRLPRLINKFSNHCLNVSKYTEICRVCMTTFKSTTAKLDHFKICANKKRGVCGRRRCRNQLVHRPYRLNKFTNKEERNGLTWQRSKCARLLKPLSFSCLDFEQLSRKIVKSRGDPTDFERTPSNAVAVQTPLSYSIQHRGLYPEIPLPANLSSPRVRFINEDDPHPEKSFFLSLLYTIREDLLFHSRFIRDLLSHDQPPPPMSQRTPEQIAYMLSVTHCQICNVRFGSKKVSPKTKAFYVVKRCLDHFHFLQDSSRIRAVTCQVTLSYTRRSTVRRSFLGPAVSFLVNFAPPNTINKKLFFFQGCNLSYSTERYDSNMTWACHYGSKYDFLLVLRALMEYGSKDVITYSRHDGTTYSRKLLKGEPRAVFKSESEIISLSFRFCCPFELCTCQLPREEREHLRLEGKPCVPCPFQRKIRFVDTYLFINFSLDKMIAGLHEARVKENIPLDKAFLTTVRYARSLNLSDHQIDVLISKKLKMPFESLTSVETMIAKTTCPESTEFSSVLYGKDGLTEQEMTDFRYVWDTCNVRNLHQLFTWYNVLDTCQMCDATAFFFDKLHATTSLYPTHYLTCSSLAMASMLYNSVSPDHSQEKLFIPYLPSHIYEFYEQNLSGGYSTNQGFWSTFNNGYFVPPSQNMSNDKSNDNDKKEDRKKDKDNKDKKEDRNKDKDNKDNDADLCSEGQFHVPPRPNTSNDKSNDEDRDKDKDKNEDNEDNDADLCTEGQYHDFNSLYPT